MSAVEKPWGVVTSEPGELKAAMTGETVIDVKDNGEWVEITLSNRFVIHFVSGCIIVHPDPGEVN